MPTLRVPVRGSAVITAGSVMNGAGSPGQQRWIGRRPRSMSSPVSTTSCTGARDTVFGIESPCDFSRFRPLTFSTSPGGGCSSRTSSRRCAMSSRRSTPNARHMRRSVPNWLISSGWLEPLGRSNSRAGPPAWTVRSTISVISRSGSTSTETRASSPSRSSSAIQSRRSLTPASLMTLMRVYVTRAGRGFVGAHVVQALREAGHEVRDRWADVRELEPLLRAVDGCEAVCHVAALYSYTAPAHELEAVNVLGTANVVEACRRAGVRRLVHTSTCGNCGPVAGRPATEADGPPEWELAVPYKRTKLEAERLALAAGAVCVTPTAPVGDGDRSPTPTGAMVRGVASGRYRVSLGS